MKKLLILLLLISSEAWAIECYKKEIPYRNSTGEVKLTKCVLTNYNEELGQYDGADQICLITHQGGISCFPKTKSK